MIKNFFFVNHMMMTLHDDRQIDWIEWNLFTWIHQNLPNILNWMGFKIYTWELCILFAESSKVFDEIIIIYRYSNENHSSLHDRCVNWSKGMQLVFNIIRCKAADHWLTLPFQYHFISILFQLWIFSFYFLSNQNNEKQILPIHWK